MKFPHIALLVLCFGLSTSESAFAFGKKPVDPPPPPPPVLEPIPISEVHASDGCEEVQVVQSPDEPSQIDFQLLVEAEKNKTISRESCGLVMPLQIPAGKQLVLENFHLSAAYVAAPGASVKLKGEVFLVGTDTPEDYLVQLDQINHGSEDLSQELVLQPQGSQLVSSCGADVNLRVQTSILIKDRGDQSIAYMEGISLTGHLKPCEE